jgi:branched-subunit amino acid ABC-type transport system permease component
MRRFATLSCDRVGLLLLVLPVQAQDAIKIAAGAPLTGSLAKQGQEVVNAVKLAVDEWNAKGGVLGKKIALVEADDQGNPQVGVAAAEKVYMTYAIFPRTWRFSIAGVSISVLVVVIACLALAMMLGLNWLVQRTWLGRSIRAVAEDREMAAQAMGIINTTVAKLQAFAIGASFAGAGGALLASWQRSVFPDNFLFTESVNILAMVILGGVGSLPGVILGATLIVALPEIFRGFALYRLLAFGFLWMVLMIFRPGGLLTFAGRREEADPTEAAPAESE